MKLFHKFFFSVVVLSCIQYQLQAQSRYIIKFKNKSNNSFSVSNPSAFLSQRSIDRRTRYNILLDSTDIPVSPQYISSLRSVPGVAILNVSKWLNQVSIQTTDITAINTINAFSFVQSSSAIAARNITSDINDKWKNLATGTDGFRSSNLLADFYNYGLSYPQIHIHNGEFLHNIGLRGQNMIVGMLDAGYLNYLTVKAFDSVRANNQILGTHDFVALESSVNEDNAHGMQCFSTIAANIPGQFIGTAPKASFYLFRTEDFFSEYPIEEHNWVCGAERLDSAGGDLISSSLGYNVFDAPLTAASYTYAQLNGNNTISVTGADLAAKKGILVVNSAGNSGNDSWKYIITPADGDSVLAVGAVNTSGVVAPFSSYGPSSDGQVKPDVAAVGVQTVIQNPNNIVGTGNGTSFAAPIMAGLATSLWQGFPEFNNMKIIDALRKAGSIASSPNDRIGYGIPDVKKALVQLTKDFATASASVAACNTTLSWKSKDMSTMKYEIERKAPGEPDYKKIGERFGTASVFSTRSYTYTDTLVNIAAGTTSYRIRQIFDTAAGTFTADIIQSINVSLSSGCITTAINPVTAFENDLLLIPNPANNKFAIRITSQNAIPELSIQIMDALGKRIRIINTQKPSGIALIPINISGLARGKYFISIYNKNILIGTRELLKL
jgi:hypothetical protein